MPVDRTADRGHAGGIEAWPDQRAGVWRWSAYDGMNRRQGTGTSEENALSQARQALDALRTTTGHLP